MFTSPGDEASALADNIKKVVEHRSVNSSRSKQKAIGLSEIGDPCARKLAYKILDWPQTNGGGDPWASIQGTAIHSWLADAFERFNDKDNPRFMIEFRVKVTDDLGGTCDLFDTVDGMVIDHKCMGTTSMKSRKRDGMTIQQRVQVNCYGLGVEKMGKEVKQVAIACYPLGGRLDGLHTIVEPYDRQIALDAIERLDGIKLLVWQLDVEANPDNWNLIPATPAYGCIYCPFYLPKSTDLSVGCPGEENAA
jgi:hypothetical protein